MWLLTGKGSMLKSSAEASSSCHQEDGKEVLALLKDKITLLEENKALLEKENTYQAKEIQRLEQEVATLKKQTKSPFPAQNVVKQSF